MACGLKDNQQSHVERSIWVHTTLLNNSSFHDCWKTFTSNDVSLNSSSSASTTRRFKGVTASSAMIESSLTSTKTKKVARTIWYLHSKGVDAFILKSKVNVMCNSDYKISWKPWHLVPMDSWNFNFDSGFKKYMGILIMEIFIIIYYVLHN